MDIPNTAGPTADGSNPRPRGVSAEMPTRDESRHVDRDASRSKPGDRVGPYKLLELIGEGGFGTVWLAERREPMVQRVAIKIIKPGMDSKAVVARFEQERQALAVMDHPNVAKVFDGGVTERGLPYFVMEHVAGEPITNFCDRHRYTIRQRLELFISVCDAVQHAHMKGIIHRDLKPSNVLAEMVDGKPLAKVIDFGIAKALVRDTEVTQFTSDGMIIGTPEYMSPEQADGQLDVDTRADVYALGVMLYELLVGRLPFDPAELRRRGHDEIRRIIREEDPPRPSAKLKSLGGASTTIADTRRYSSASLIRELRRELEWIPLQAMRKERERRYRSAGSMAADIDNYLHLRPLDAAPESKIYVFRKLVRRRRALAISAATVVASLMTATVGISVFAWRAESRRLEADRRLLQIERVSGFQQSALEGVTPERVGASLLSALLSEAAASGARRGLPEAERAAIIESLRGTTRPLDVPGIATKTLEESVFGPTERKAREEFKDDPVVLGAVLQGLANVYMALGAREKAYQVQVDTIELRRTSLGPSHVETIRAMNTAASMCRVAGRYERFQHHAEEAYKAAMEFLGPDHLETFAAAHWLGVALVSVERSRAEDLLTSSLDGRRRALPPAHPDTIWSMLALIGFYQDSGRAPKAEALLDEALRTCETSLGPNHEITLYARRYLRRQYERTSRLPMALEVGRDLQRRRDEILGPLHPSSITEIGSVVRLLLANRKVEEAAPLAEEYFNRSVERFGPDNPISKQAEQLLKTVRRQTRKQQSR